MGGTIVLVEKELHGIGQSLIFNMIDPGKVCLVMDHGMCILVIPEFHHEVMAFTRLCHKADAVIVRDKFGLQGQYRIKIKAVLFNLWRDDPA